MRRICAALLLGCAALAGVAAPYAPQEFDFSGLENTAGAAYGLVESVEPAQLTEPVHIDVFEHAVRPGTARRLVIRLDNGAGISIVHDGPERLEPGQRVYVLLRGGGALVEPVGLEP